MYIEEYSPTVYSFEFFGIRHLTLLSLYFNIGDILQIIAIPSITTLTLLMSVLQYNTGFTDEGLRYLGWLQRHLSFGWMPL